MSINGLPGRVKFHHTDDVLTNNASLLGHHGLATQFGLIEELGRSFHSYTSNRAYRDFTYPYLQILSHAAGGVGIEETRRISADLPLGRLLFPDQAANFDEHPHRSESYLPAPNTLGDWYRRARPRHAHRARKINRGLCKRIINQRRPESIHIDIDSKMHASSNRKAKRNRNGIKGYAPLYATLAGLNLVLDPLFRPGNAHPAANNASMTRTVLSWLNGVEVDRVFLTIDNAGCQVEVMKAVEQAHLSSDKQIHVYTRPSSPDETMPDKMFESIRQAGGDWNPIKIYYENNRKRYRYLTEYERKQQDDDKKSPQILDADYPLTSENEEWNGRLILVREPVIEGSAQKSFATGWRYYPVLTNDYRSDPIEIPSRYNRRGGAEDTIGEIVQEGEAERFPCREDEGNALYLALCVMGHNLDQAMKMVADQEFEPPSIKTGPEEEVHEERQNNTTSGPVRKPAHQESAQLLAEESGTETSWLQFTIRKFKQLLLSIPARITSGGRYRHVNISSHHPFGKLLEEVIRACWRSAPLLTSRPPP